MNYPKGIKEQIKKTETLTTYGKRGMTLEKEINDSNTYYRESNKAFIYKKPTPIKITKVAYPNTNSKVIKEAYFDVPSTTDYNGIYKGKYIDFEAKETKSKTSFPLKNIHDHQIQHLKRCALHGGICFLIVRFTTLQETYLLFQHDLLSFLEEQSRNSIPLSYFREKGFRVPDKYIPSVDYLEIIEQVYGGVLNDK